MASTRRSCKNKPDVFCYICSEYTIVPNRNQVTSFIKRAYHSYFGIKLGDQDKAWVTTHGMQVMHQVSASVDQRQEELSEVWNSHGLEGADKPCH